MMLDRTFSVPPYGFRGNTYHFALNVDEAGEPKLKLDVMEDGPPQKFHSRQMRSIADLHVGFLG